MQSIGTRLRLAVERAAHNANYPGSSSFVPFPLIGPAVWTPTTAYSAGNVVLNSAAESSLYLCVVAGTSGAAAPTDHSPQNIVDGSISWAYMGRIGVSAPYAGTVPVALTEPASINAALTLEYRYQTQPNAFLPLGGKPILSVTPPYYGIRSVPVSFTIANGVINPTTDQKTAAWVFETDAPMLVIESKAPSSAYRILVDGQYLSLSSRPSPNGFTTIDWNGFRRMRAYQVQIYGAYLFKAVWVDPFSTVSAPTFQDAVNACVIGDNVITNTWGLPDFDFASLITRRMGWTNVQSAIQAGCGWNEGAAPGNTTLRFGERPSDYLTDVSPDIVIVWGGLNDTVPTLAADVTAFIKTLRQTLPYAVIVIMGMFASPQQGGNLSPSLNAMEAAIQSGVATAGDQNTFFIPLITDAKGPWLSGTGVNGAPTASGNSSVYVYSNQFSLNPGGTIMFVERLMAELKRLINIIK